MNPNSVHSGNNIGVPILEPHRLSLSNDERDQLLTYTNKLLTAVGLSAKGKFIHSTEELSRVASSLFVAIFESLFHTRIEGIIRSPQSTADYVTNAQLVIDQLSDQIQVDLKHITGNSVVSGDLRVLSNLVHILLKIVSLTSQESLTSYGSKDFDQDGVLHRYRATSGHASSDSISTHESTFQDAGVSKTGGELFHNFSSGVVRNSRAPGDPIGGFKLHSEALELQLQRSVARAEENLRVERKIESARRRRERNLQLREARSRAKNLKQQDTSRKALTQRWKNDRQLEQRANFMRQNNEELSMLRKVYKNLLKKELHLRVEERKEDIQRKLQIRDQARWQIESLQSLFEERLQILLPDEQQQGSLRRNERLIREELKIADELARSINHRHDSLLEQERNNLSQHNERQFLRKHEAHRDLLTMLSATNWQEMLRSGNTTLCAASAPFSSSKAKARK